MLNTGSSSLKWVVLDVESEGVLRSGEASWHDPEPRRHAQELADALRQISDIDAIGHRVVHGGARFRNAAIIDDAVRQAIVELAPLAPLHNPAAVDGIDAARRQFPGLPQVAAFDTAYHSTIPEVASTYPVPWEWTEQRGVRRFGFHGLSVEYAVSRASSLLGGMPARMVVCHLGAGCSVTAVRDGRSIDTSMGFTPLEGVMMARRSGSVDPGLLLHLLQSVDVASLDTALNERSGLLGVSGVSADMREVLAAAGAGNRRAALARDMFVYRVAACVGALVTALGGLDTLVFTGGIGEHSDAIRSAICDRLLHLGASVSDEMASADDRDIAAAASNVRVLVITAREDLTVLRATRALLDEGG